MKNYKLRKIILDVEASMELVEPFIFEWKIKDGSGEFLLSDELTKEYETKRAANKQRAAKEHLDLLNYILDKSENS